VSRGGPLIEVPAAFRAFGRWQREGAAGRRWLASLPARVAVWSARWDLVVDGPPWHGGNGIAVPVRRAGEPLVLKVTWPDPLVVEEVAALRMWDGHGTVLLVEASPAEGVLLLERLGAPMTDLPVMAALAAAATLLRRLAVPAPSSSAVTTTGEYAATLRDELPARWDAVGRPFPLALLDRATGLAGDLSGPTPPVLVNRDLHYGNALRGRREPWLAVDPLAFAGDLEHQCGQLLWTRLDELPDIPAALAVLVETGGLDPDRARAWAVLRAVDYWLWGLAAGFTLDPVRCARIVAELP
jgi:streptomycin 6-kinase